MNPTSGQRLVWAAVAAFASVPVFGVLWTAWPQQNRRGEDLPAVCFLSLLGGAAVTMVVAKVREQWGLTGNTGREILVRAGHCHECGYDLRGTGDRCPECGTGVLSYPPAAEEGRLAAAQALADAARLHAEAILFVYDAFAVRRVEVHRPARAVVGDVCSYARVVFPSRDRALAVFHHWGIRSSDDLGRAIFAMVRAGWIGASDNDKESDFDGLGTIEELLDASKGEVR